MKGEIESKTVFRHNFNLIYLEQTVLYDKNVTNYISNSTKSIDIMKRMIKKSYPLFEIYFLTD